MGEITAITCKQPYEINDSRTMYESASFEHFHLQPDEEVRWRQATSKAASLPGVNLLLDFLREKEDLYTIRHSRTVGDINAALAIKAGASDEVACDAAVVGYLHDMGKYHIQHLIHINGPLTKDQYEETKLHAPKGALMVAAAGFMRPITHGVGNSHGYQRDPYPTYPDALYDPESYGPLSPDHIIGTGVAAADVHDAMRSARPGRDHPLPMEAAMGAVNELSIPLVIKQAYRDLFAEAVSLETESMYRTAA